MSKSTKKTTVVINFYAAVVLIVVIGVIFYTANNYINLNKLRKGEVISPDKAASLYSNVGEAEAKLNEISTKLDDIDISNYPLNGQFHLIYPELKDLEVYLNSAVHETEEVANLKLAYGKALDSRRERCYENFDPSQLNMDEIAAYQMDLLSNYLMCDYMKQKPVDINECQSVFGAYAAAGFNMVGECQNIFNNTIVYRDLVNYGECKPETLQNCQIVDSECAEFCKAFVAKDTTMCAEEDTVTDLAECLTILTGNDIACQDLPSKEAIESCQTTHKMMTAFRGNDLSICDDLPQQDAHNLICQLVLMPDISQIKCKDDNYERFRKIYCGVPLN